MSGRTLKNQKGQAVLETVMLFGVVAALWLALVNGLKNRDFFQQTFGEPWGRLRNTIEFGVPSNNARDVGTKHPASFYRHATRKPRG